jgi:hypothetical protein
LGALDVSFLPAGQKEMHVVKLLPSYCFKMAADSIS